MPDGLADDFEVADNSIDSFLIVAELLEIQATDVPFDLGNRIDNVLDAEPPFSRRQQRPRVGFGREAVA
jgi:hypothetical protein